MGDFSKALSEHPRLQVRSTSSLARLDQIRTKALDPYYEALQKESICIFVAGSLGRKEAGLKSDFDVFLLTSSIEAPPKLDEYEIFASLIELNRALSFEKFSRDGRFLKIHTLDQLVSETGKPQDDSENRFTTRMLLLLESQVVVNEKLYHTAIETIASNYFRDSVGKKDFRPLFLLNDVLRFWRTLCLNYEELRNERDRPWLKKNLNLKFSRKLTVFSTALSIVTGRIHDKTSLMHLSKEAPLDRLAAALDHMDDRSLLDRFGKALEDYEFFLLAKEEGEGEGESTSDDRLNRVYETAASRFGDFLFAALDSKKLDPKMRRYLVI